MTTLYAALAASFWTREGKVPPSPPPGGHHAPDGTPWAIQFDLDRARFVFEEAEEAPLFPAKTLPLAVLLDDAAYDEWRAKASLSREQVNRARALRSAFTDYLIPVVPLATDDIGVVTLTFKRVNSGGTPMGDADMTRVLAWSPEFDLRDQIEAVRENLKPCGWGELEEDALLKVVAAVSGLDPTEVDMEKLAKKIQEEPSRVLLAGERVAGAVRLLDERVGIKGPDSLPYTQILVLVARILDRADGLLTREQETKLVAWVAEVCLDERFQSGVPHMIRAYFRALSLRLGLPPDAPPRARDQEQSLVKECWVFSMAWARSRGTALVLASQEPTDARGRPFDDPFAMIARGSDNVGMLLAVGAPGIRGLRERLESKQLKTALRSPANRVVCPPPELPALRAALFQDTCPDALLRGHLVDREAHRALQRGELEDFFERRRRAILDAEKRWVEARGGEVKILPEPRTYAQG
jgi:hypothetical protein